MRENLSNSNQKIYNHFRHGVGKFGISIMIATAKEKIMASVSRKVKREIERRFKRLKLTSVQEYVMCSMFEETFGQHEESEKLSYRGDITLTWIKDNLHKFWTGVREYQRFKVKDTHWKQTIVQDVLLSGVRVPELTLRVRLDTNDEGVTIFSFEVVDGQQRITAFIEFMDDKFTINIDGKEMKYSEMETQASGLYNQFNNLAFGAIYYENITNEEASTIFKKVNDQTDINCQEDRNAIFGPYSRYIADRTYYGSDRDSLHSLFERGISTTGTGSKTVKTKVLRNFPKLKINLSRMEQCEWFSHLIHWDCSGLRSATNQDTHSLWQMDLNPYTEEWDGRSKAENLLKIANQMMTAASPDQKENDVTPMILQVMVLWYKELTSNSTLGDYWSIVVDDFVNGFLSCIDDYSWDSKLDRERAENNERCRSKGKDDKPWTMFNTSDDMNKMKDLFGGHNLRAINTVLQILEHELEINPEQFGALQLDSERLFTRDMIIAKWKEQGKCDAITGEPLDRNNLSGDHIIPHSYGKKRGGVTTWENLQVVAKHRNLKKGNSSEELKMAA